MFISRKFQILLTLLQSLPDAQFFQFCSFFTKRILILFIPKTSFPLMSYRERQDRDQKDVTRNFYNSFRNVPVMVAGSAGTAILSLVFPIPVFWNVSMSFKLGKYFIRIKTRLYRWCRKITRMTLSI